jgi:hypothetical protein
MKAFLVHLTSATIMGHFTLTPRIRSLIFRWVHLLILGWILFWVMLGTLSFPAHSVDAARGPGKDAAWRLDVRALGYIPPTLHGDEKVGHQAPAIGTLCFVGSNSLIVTFTTRLETEGLPRRSDADATSLPIRLHALFVDSKSGQLQTSREWPTASERSRINPAPDSGFIVITPERLILYSPDFREQKELILSLARESDLTSFTSQASPGSNYLLIKYTPPSGDKELHKLVDLKNLLVIASGGQRERWVHAVSDTGRVTLGTGGQATVTEALDSRYLDCPESDSNCSNGVYVSDDTLFSVAPPRVDYGPNPFTGAPPSRYGMVMSLMRIDGEALFKEELPHNEVVGTIQPLYPAVGGGRFAAAIYQGRGGSDALDIAPHFSLKMVTVFDSRTGHHVYTLDARAEEIKSISAIALSPDGSLLSLINQDGMLESYRVP